MLFRYFRNNFEVVPVALILIDITFVFYISHALYFYRNVFYFNIFSASFFITFLSAGIASSINIIVPFSLLLILMVLYICTC